MLKRLLPLFLLVNVIGVVANLPSILAALDGESIGETVGEWTIGVGTATGDLVEEIAVGLPDEAEILAIEEQVRSGALGSPLEDEHVANLVELWRVLDAAGSAVDAQRIADLLAEEGVDVEDLPDDPLGDSVP